MKHTYTIYELTEYYQNILDAMLDPEADEDAIYDEMEWAEDNIKEKADGYAKVMSVLESNIAAIKEEETRLANRRRAIENNVKRMKETLQSAMELTGLTKFKTDLFSFNVQNNPTSVVLDCEVLDLPKEFIKYTNPTADKKSIKSILESGSNFPFAHLEQTKSLRIR